MLEAMLIEAMLIAVDPSKQLRLYEANWSQ